MKDKTTKQWYIYVFWGKKLNVEIPRGNDAIMAGIHLEAFKKGQS